MHPYYQQARFTQSATTRQSFPPEFGYEIAFAGRSNAGKSSTLNRVCGQKSLARTSKTPGRTQLINFFELPEGRYLVDLPGYGYAKVPEAVKKQWGKFIESYLTERFTLKGLVLIMDIRHPLREQDEALLNWAEKQQLLVHVVLNKADKLKRGAAKNKLLATQRHLSRYSSPVTVQTFSALNNTGIEQLWETLDDWFGLSHHTNTDK
ncbi:MAG: ribosome biogenesis GTP-binding protein YihA/YsxC [bacterium]